MAGPVVAALAALVLAACAGTDSGGGTANPQSRGTTITVYSTPTCGCCRQYIGYLEQQGFAVDVIQLDDLQAVKADLGVPQEAQSCHTSVLEGYVIEGHVPVEALDKLLAEQPAIDGLALPGMPAGAPGMEGAKETPFVVVSIQGGRLEPYMTV